MDKKPITNNNTGIFQIHAGKSRTLLGEVGVERIMWRGGQDRQLVIFKVMLPEGKALLESIMGSEDDLEIRHLECGLFLDDPFGGDKVLTIKNIVFKDGWINKPHPLAYSAEIVFFSVMAHCTIEFPEDES